MRLWEQLFYDIFITGVSLFMRSTLVGQDASQDSPFVRLATLASMFPLAVYIGFRVTGLLIDPKRSNLAGLPQVVGLYTFLSLFLSQLLLPLRFGHLVFAVMLLVIGYTFVSEPHRYDSYRATSYYPPERRMVLIPVGQAIMVSGFAIGLIGFAPGVGRWEFFGSLGVVAVAPVIGFALGWRSV